MKTLLKVFSLVLAAGFLSLSFAQGVRRPPAKDYGPDKTHALYMPANATLLVKTEYVLDGRPRGWAEVWFARESAKGKADLTSPPTGLAIYRLIGGDNPPGRMLSNVRLKRSFIPFDSAGLDVQVSEQDTVEGMVPKALKHLVWRCKDSKPCLDEKVWLGYPDPEADAPLQDSLIIEVSPSAADATRLIEEWKKR